MSGPMREGPLPDDGRNVVPEGDDEPFWWDVVMADSGTHWTELNRRRGNQRFYPPKEHGEDAG